MKKGDFVVSKLVFPRTGKAFREGARTAARWGQRHADGVRYGRREGENEGTTAATATSDMMPETENPAALGEAGSQFLLLSKRVL